MRITQCLGFCRSMVGAVLGAAGGWSWRGPWTVLALVATLSCGGGSGGGSAGQPPPPPTNLVLAQGGSFDEVVLSWTPPATPVDGYSVEDSIDSGAFTVEPALIPGNAVGADVTLDDSVPELLMLKCR